MQLNLPILDTKVQILDTKNGHHDENHPHYKGYGMSEKPKGS
jgi:hypothetical protein